MEFQKKQYICKLCDYTTPSLTDGKSRYLQTSKNH